MQSHQTEPKPGTITDFDWSDDPSLACLVTSTARRLPNNIAIRCGGTALSYEELDRRSSAIAHELLRLGVQVGEVVCIVADHTAESIIAIVGVLKAGAAYLPLDVQLPPERLSYFVEKADARFAVGNALPAGLDGSLKLVRPQNVEVAPESSDGSRGQLPAPDAERLAYVLFTSGSTGKPKGVILNHRGPVNTIRDINNRFAVCSDDKTLCLSALGFDLSVYDLFGMFAVGGTVVLPTRKQSRNPSEWLQLVQEHGITVWNTVPALMDILVTATSDEKALDSLETIMLSGDWIPLTLPDRIRKLVPRAKIWSLGGSTEASIWSVFYEIEEVAEHWTSIPYGRSLLNQRCYVLNQKMEQCEVGEPGELCIAGVGVALGYINDGERTDQQFVADPFDSRDNASKFYGSGLLYKTGDLCRYDADGVLEFLGRMDRQVKINGHRVGLGEIESELVKQTGVVDAIAKVVTSDAGQRLVAYIRVSDETNSPDQAAILAELKLHLPSYMVPSQIVSLTQWPLSPNGKIDYAKLPSTTDESLEITSDQNDAAEQHEGTERWLSDTLSELLRVPSVPLDQSFYSSGGTSLTALTLMARTRQAFGVVLDYKTILDRDQPLRSLAAAIDEAVDSLPPESARTLELAFAPGNSQTAPLSYQQRQMWIVNEIESNRTRYNVPLAYEIAGDVDQAALAKALNTIVDRHHVLRTVIDSATESEHDSTDQLTQRVIDRDSDVLKITRLSSSNDEPLEKHPEVQSFVRSPFDLSTEAPFRASLFTGTTSSLLVCVFHHIAVDGQSVGILNRELEALYASECGLIQPAEMPELVQYADYARAQQSNSDARPQSRERNREFWSQELASPPPPVSLPSDFTKGSAASNQPEGETVRFTLRGETVHRLREFAVEKQTTAFAVLLSSLKVLLSRYSGQEDLIVGTTVSTRDLMEIERTIGYFIGVLPIRSEITPESQFASICEQVHQRTISALSHKDFPLEEMQANLASEGSPQELFNVLFVLEDDQPAPQLGDAVVTERKLHTGTAKFDLLVSAIDASTEINVELEYNARKYSRDRIEQFARHFEIAVEQCLDQPCSRVAELPIADNHSVLGRPLTDEQPGSTELDQPSGSIMAAIQTQCETNHGAVAVHFAEAQYTYAELNRASTIIASRMTEQGVAAGDLVGIHVSRSPQMIASVLGVLRCGAVCVPVDPILPQQRKTEIIQAARPKLILTDQQEQSASMNFVQALDKLAIVDVSDSFNDRASETTQGYYSHDTSELIYVLFTSGSTGEPKGVKMPFGVINNLIHWQLSQSASRGAKSTLQFASLGFDVAFQEILATLASGGALHVVDQPTHADLNSLWDTLVQERIERAFLPYVALNGLCEIAKTRGEKCSLREIVTAGERLVITDTIRRFFESHSGCKLTNQYGPTESHVVSYYDLSGKPENWPSKPPIGVPVQAAELAVVSPDRVAMPRGSEGELWIGEQCIASGYLDGNDSSDARFIESTLPGYDSRKWYRTGDVCRVNWEGQLEFIGRNDDQIKVRGNRVELGEVEVQLHKHTGVLHAAVLANSSSHATSLVAFVEPTDAPLEPASMQALVHDLKDALTSKLPDYMVPSTIYIRDQLPKSVNGKVDRQQLRLELAKLAEDHGARRDRQSEQAVVDDPFSKSVASIWESVLRCPVDLNSNFFDCGGNSLAAAIMFARLRTTLGVKVSMSILVANPTLQQFTATLTQDVASKNEVRGVVVLGESAERSVSTADPVYCLPGIDGHFLNFRALARRLSEERNVFGLEPIGLFDLGKSKLSFEELAAEQIRALRQQQHTSIYHLVGFSFGGVLAYEMAQQLWRAGHRATLCMIDATPGVPVPSSTLQSFGFHARLLSTLPWGQWPTYLNQRLKAGYLSILHRAGAISLDDKIRRVIDLDESYGRVAAANMVALEDYRPQPSLGPATLFRARIRAKGGSGGDPTAGWQPYFQEQDLRLYEVPGAHTNMLAEDQVSQLSHHIQRLLNTPPQHASALEPSGKNLSSKSSWSRL